MTSGINSKDAICLKLTGRTTKTESHNEAPSELKKTGEVGQKVAPTLHRLLNVKSRSQYQTTPMARSQAENAARWAQKLYDALLRFVDA